MRVNYRKTLMWAILDPVIVHGILLTLAVLFSPFFGLGWLAGTYAAGRFLGWRHPRARMAWLGMVVYAMLTAGIFEVLFARILWL